MKSIMIKKWLICLFSCLMFYGQVLSQSPQAFKYQAVARDASGNVLANQDVSFQVSILEGSADGTLVYRERYFPITNQFGLVSLDIGLGTAILGNFTDIEWGNNAYFLQIAMDLSGGTSFTVLGTSQILSVPYALFAKDVENVDDADADPANELITDVQLTETTLEITDAGGIYSVDLITLQDGTGTDDQQLSLSDHLLSIEDGNSVDLSDYMVSTDSQDLSLSGNILLLTNDPTSVDLSGYLDNTDNQDLELKGNLLYLTDDATPADLSGYLDNTDKQDLSLSGTVLKLTNDPTTVDLLPFMDNTDTQAISLKNHILEISGNSSVVDLNPYAFPVGSILPYAGQVAPHGWLLCDGKMYDMLLYEALFKVIGNTYGSSGSQFAVPDLRGRVIAGINIIDPDFSPLGKTGGAKTHTLNAGEMPVHTHVLIDPGHNHSVSDPGHYHSVNDPGHTHSINDPGHSHTIDLDDGLTGGGGVDDAGESSEGNDNTGTSTTGISLYSSTTGINLNNAQTGIAIQNHTTGITMMPQGMGMAHNNLQPYLVLNYIIKY